MSYRLIQGSAHDMREIADGSVHCVVTSPPYFGLRAYAGDQGIEWATMEYSPMPGLSPLRIQGCEPDCAHEWADGRTIAQRTQRDHDSNGNFGATRGNEASRQGMAYKVTQGAYCIHCCGWRGALGLEPTIEMYIGHLILIMRELWRVLRDDGTAFINLGDSYSGSGGAHTFDHANPGLSNSAHRDGATQYRQDGGRGPAKGNGLRPKNLMGVPQRFMLAAQAEGWIVRSAMPWIKRNGMPESVTDRPAQVVESIFILAKSERYFWDGEAVKEPNSPGSVFTGLIAGHHKNGERYSGTDKIETGKGGQMQPVDKGGRNFRSSDLFFKTWQGLLSNDDGDPLAMVVNPQPFSGAHFACFPLLIPEIAIRAGTSAYGVCSACGAPWRRCVEREAHGYNEKEGVAQRLRNQGATNGGTEKVTLGVTHLVQRHTTGWEPTCECNAGEPIPATVLDCFGGSQTTGKAALKLGRSYIGVDISETYLTELAPDRLSNIQMEMPL